MKSLKTIIILITIFLSAVAFAENTSSSGENSNKTSITGTITDKFSKEELVCVIVEVEDKEISTCTDVNGSFTLNDLEPGKYTLKVKYISYKEILLEDIRLKKNKTTELNIQLEPIM